MRFTFVESGDFYVHELFTDSAGAKIAAGGKTVELRIWRIVQGGVWQLYDWDAGQKIFRASSVVDDEDTCTHKLAGGVYATGNWENDTAISFAAFVVGDVYVFEFLNATDSEVVAQNEIQWSGQYGDIAKQSTTSTAAAVTAVNAKTTNLPASPAAVGSKMDLDEAIAKNSGKLLSRGAGQQDVTASGTSRIISHKKLGVPGTVAFTETIDEAGNAVIT